MDIVRERIMFPSVSSSSKGNVGKDAVIDTIAGTMGGIACVYVGQPLDTVKVKMQTFPKIYNNMINCFMETFRKDGIRRGLYAGTVPALAANIAENSILFLAYGLCKKMIAVGLRKDVKDLTPYHLSIAGFFSGFFSSLTLCPTELVKCQLQAMRETSAPNINAKMPHIGPWMLCRKIFREEGFLGFYRGLTSTFAREMPGYFFFFGGYEISRNYFTPPGTNPDDIGPLKTTICGGFAGLTLWVAIFPTDVVKSRIQVNKLNITLTRCLIDIYKNEGIRALYNGLGPTVVRTFPATGALFLAVEYTKKFLHHITEKDLF